MTVDELLKILNVPNCESISKVYLKELLEKLNKLDPDLECEEYIKSVPNPYSSSLDKKIILEDKYLLFREKYNIYFGRGKHLGTPLGMMEKEGKYYILLGHFTSRDEIREEILRNISFKDKLSAEEYKEICNKFGKDNVSKVIKYDWDIECYKRVKGTWLYGEFGNCALIKINENQHLSQVLICIELDENLLNFYELIDLKKLVFCKIEDSQKKWLNSVFNNKEEVPVFCIRENKFDILSLSNLKLVWGPKEYIFDQRTNFNDIKDYLISLYNEEKEYNMKYISSMMLICYLRKLAIEEETLIKTGRIVKYYPELNNKELIIKDNFNTEIE